MLFKRGTPRTDGTAHKLTKSDVRDVIKHENNLKALKTFEKISGACKKKKKRENYFTEENASIENGPYTFIFWLLYPNCIKS